MRSPIRRHSSGDGSTPVGLWQAPWSSTTSPGAALEARSIPGDWSSIAEQRGMVALLGLSTEQVTRLRDEHAVYVVGRGRINVAGFTAANLEPFADALGAVLASG
jgi:hypothetical protein